MEAGKTFYAPDRTAWRRWLADNYTREKEIWLIIPLKASGEKRLSYNDTVEEALCFGWIDSTVKKLDPQHTVQRFSPRQAGSSYSRANIERLIWLDGQGLLQPEIRAGVREIIHKPYPFPADIIGALKQDAQAWEHFSHFPLSYQRIRIAYVDGARKRPGEFQKRLASLVRSAHENKMLGYGGIEKYY
jgi:uncharacterized protein YdeI (YjbR/CyaY-like superfamily)